MTDSIVIIMAGGLGKRMNSELPKVLHTIHGEPMLIRILKETYKIHPEHIYIVVGKYKSIIEETIYKYIENIDSYPVSFIEQWEPLGTGHAIQCCIPAMKNHIGKKVLVLSGDVPLITQGIMRDMLTDCIRVKIMTTYLDDPTGYGRIINSDGLFVKIVEEKDASSEEKKIRQVNCGIYAFDVETLCRYLPEIKNENSQGEYYLTDVIAIIKMGESINIDMYDVAEENQIHILGVNTKEQLDDLEKII